MKRNLKAVFLLSMTLAACSAPKKEQSFVEKTESAHQKSAFLDKEAIKFDLVLKFGGKERLNGSITLLTNSSKGLIEYGDSSKIMYVKDKVYYSPDITNTKGIRFDAYTWSYFFLLPHKLSDGGTKLTPYENSTLNRETFDTQKLTFAPGTGDAPDDWYILYSDKESHLLETAAYIVTAGKTKEEAEADPHAISYADYTEIDGIPIAQTWSFWGWKEDKGLTEQLGEATLTNIQFVEVDSNFFAPSPSFLTIE